jgi:hypothetical protein
MTVNIVVYAASADDQHHATSVLLVGITARCTIQPAMMKHSSADSCQHEYTQSQTQWIAFVVVDCHTHRIAHVLFAYITAGSGSYAK